MSKKKYIKGYFDCRVNIHRYPKCTYYIFFGERRNGKTYSAKLEIIDSIKNGFRFVYMRRKHAHVVEKKCRDTFKDVQWYAKERLGQEIEFDSRFGFYIMKDDERYLVGYVHTVEEAMENKGGVYNDIEYIFFDEFIDYVYMIDEIRKFKHALANCYSEEIEDRIHVIMIGNTIKTTATNPYFELFNIDTKKIRQGKTYFFEDKKGANGLFMWTPISVHTDEDLELHTKRNKLIGFSDEESDMMLLGEWEYNRCNVKPIDDVYWHTRERHLAPFYVTSMDNVFELSLFTDYKLPILFVRPINTQDGKVNQYIKYNLCFDNTVVLRNKEIGIVPTISHMTSLVDKDTLSVYKICLDCIDSGRVVYKDLASGSMFVSIMREIRRPSSM